MTAPKTTRRTTKAPAKPTPEEVIVEEAKTSVEEDKPEASPKKTEKTSQIRVLSGGFLVAGRILTEGSVIEVTEDLGDTSEGAQIAAYGKVCFEKI